MRLLFWKHKLQSRKGKDEGTWNKKRGKYPMALKFYCHNEKSVKFVIIC